MEDWKMGWEGNDGDGKSRMKMGRAGWKIGRWDGKDGRLEDGMGREGNYEDGNGRMEMGREG